MNLLLLTIAAGILAGAATGAATAAILIRIDDRTHNDVTIVPAATDKLTDTLDSIDRSMRNISRRM